MKFLDGSVKPPYSKLHQTAANNPKADNPIYYRHISAIISVFWKKYIVTIMIPIPKPI
ncbi:MAG: hypothetical protein LBK06_02410 [Planctomycetaceae bacterium]|nr:hypothetical protein [Planctomycetaceae bacterium]